MGTFALSYRRFGDAEQSEIPNLVIHFNHWQLAKGARGLQFIDLGFNIQNADVVGCIKLIVPLAFSNAEVVDLSYTLQDIENLKSVFNRILRINHNGSGELSAVSYDKDLTDYRFNFLLFTIESAQISLTFKDGHTVYLINLTPAQRNQIAIYPTKSIYVRLRILGSSVSNLTSISKPSLSKPFLTSFYEGQMIEVNFNRERNLPRGIVEPEDLSFKIASLNYFLIKDAKYAFKSSSRPYDNMRRLEQSIWNDYISLPENSIKRNQDYYDIVKDSILRFNNVEAGMSKDHLLAYQWDFDGVGSDFNVFARFQREFVNLKYFIIGLVLISLFFELSGNYLYDWLTKEPAQQTQQSIIVPESCEGEN